MATVHLGRKRSYNEMRAHDIIPHMSTSRRSSRDTVQSALSSRESSVAPVLPSETNSHAATPRRLPRQVAFDSDATILIVGIRGVGKSSLGFLAATAYSRRLIESDRSFLEATGSTATVFRKAHGAAEYHRRHADVLKNVLSANDKHSVVVCNFSDLEAQGADLIQEFAQSHPVIRVSRDAEAMRSQLRVLSADRVAQLLRASEPLLRACSNFDFYNVSESAVNEDLPIDLVSNLPSSRPTTGRFLTLKRAERDFLKFLRNVIGDAHRSKSHQSAYPLSQLSVEQLDFTSAVVVTAKQVISGSIDLEEAQIGVDAIRLVASLDHDTESGQRYAFHSTSEAFALLRRSTILPIWLSVTAEQVRSKESSAMSDLLEYCLRLAPEYCSIDLSSEPVDISHTLANRGGTRIIGYFASRERLENGWQNQRCLEVYERARDLGFDLVEFVMPSRSLKDNFGASAFRQKVDHLYDGQGPGLIAYWSGLSGRTSMCFNNTLTPVAASQREVTGSESTIPLVTAKQRTQALFASFVYEPLRFFIYGGDVDFSLSPAMHNAAYDACGMLHAYRTHSAPNMDDFRGLVNELDFGGAAVVQPHKLSVLSMMDVLSPHARAIGALNTVIPLRDDYPAGSPPDYAAIFRERNKTGVVKALYGDNTDWIGIRACIRRGLSPANTVRPQSSGLVCGAGGMARAAIYAMISLGVRNIFICNRTSEHASALATHYNELIQAKNIVELSTEDAPSTYVSALESFSQPWPKSARHPTMIVSCIPTQQADGSPTNFTIPCEWLNSRTSGVVVELAYKPIVTPLVRQIRNMQDQGWILMDGLDVLPEQAFAQFELFTGRRAPRKLMRDQVLKYYHEDEIPSHGALNTDSPTHA